MNIKFNPLTNSDFQYLLTWLQKPHVKKWWDQDINYTLELVKEKYSTYVDGYKKIGNDKKPIYPFIIYYDDRPIGYIQYYNAYDFPRDGYELNNNLPKSLASMDMFIGDNNYLGKSIGTNALELFLENYIFTKFDYVFVDIDDNNLAAIKTYVRAEFGTINGMCNNKISMLRKKEVNWDLYYDFEEIVYKGNDYEIKKILDQFDIYDFLVIPIIFDLVTHKKIRLLKLLHNKGVSLTYEEWCGGNALHVACGAGGNIESVKFLIENKILEDINKKSSKYGDTPLTLAISYDHNDIVEYFKNKFGINSISLNDLEVVLKTMKANFRRSYFK